MKTMTDNPQTIPGFKCVETMRAIRDKRDRVMATMTREERLAFLGVTLAVTKKCESPSSFPLSRE
ncbi:MAG: hypothetical protein ACRC46_04525 [Thermoguttaceae bacterium]